MAPNLADAVSSAINKIAERSRDRREGQILTPWRRLARFAPSGERIVAITFNGGPMKLVCEPDVAQEIGFTEHLLNVMAEFGARGTFCVIGSTAENYPDTSGRPGSPYALGNKYDHFAAFGLDDMAGAEVCSELVRRIAREGHELANNTYRHVPYGRVRGMSATRATIGGLDEAVRDLRRLHELIFKLTKCEMRMMSPPRGIDKLPDGRSAFDACSAMRYHYLDSSLDGGGYAPSGGDYDTDVEAMISPLRDALESEPNCLSGQIIRFKDGCNLSKQTPTASALRRILELFERYGYRVLTVGEMLERSAFEDVRPAHDCFEAVRELDKLGVVMGMRNNKFYPEQEMTKAEVSAVFSSLRGETPSEVKIVRDDTAPLRMISANAAEIFEHTSAQPKSIRRGDVAIWLFETIMRNGTKQIGK